MKGIYKRILAAAAATMVGVCSMSVDAQATGKYMEDRYNWDMPSETLDDWTTPDQNVVTVNDDNTLSIIYSVSGKDTQTMHVVKTGLTGKRISEQQVQLPGKTWGGIYRPDDGYVYIATGNGSDAKWYFTKLTTDYSIVATAKVTGDISYTKSALDTGCDMVKWNKYLIVRSSKIRTDSHQSNITFIIDTKSMKVVDKNDYEWGWAYTSHSFNQIIKKDSKRGIFMVDHGDGHPRAINFNYAKLYVDKNGKARLDVNDNMSLLDIKGKVGMNYTGTTLDAFEIGQNNDIAIGTSIHHDTITEAQFETEAYSSPDADGNSHLPIDIYVSLVNKDHKSSQLKWITSYSKDDRVGVMRAIKKNDNEFVLVYGLRHYLNSKKYECYTCYMTIDSDGNVLSEGKVKEPFYDTSLPVLVGNELMWTYTVSNGKNKYMTMSLTTMDITNGSMNIYPLDIGKTDIIKYDSDGLFYTNYKEAEYRDDGSEEKAHSLPEDGYITAGETYYVRLNGYIKEKDYSGIPFYAIVGSSNPDVAEVVGKTACSENRFETPDEDIGKKLCCSYAILTVKAKKPGKTTITATTGNIKKSFPVVVKNNPPSTYIGGWTSGNKKVKLKWLKKDKVEGYQIQVGGWGHNDKITNPKTYNVNDPDKTSKTISMKTKANKSYMTRIRTYRTVDGKKYYSKWRSEAIY